MTQKARLVVAPSLTLVLATRFFPNIEFAWFAIGFHIREMKGRFMERTVNGIEADSLRNEATRRNANVTILPRRSLGPSDVGTSIGMRRFLNQQNTERYTKLLYISFDETQRRQLRNLLEEEKEEAAQLVLQQ